MMKIVVENDRMLISSLFYAAHLMEASALVLFLHSLTFFHLQSIYLAGVKFKVWHIYQI